MPDTSSSPESKREKQFPPAETGNASNPSPREPGGQPGVTDQLLNEKAERYLRESANIEDMPDPQDQQDADKTLKEHHQ